MSASAEPLHKRLRSMGIAEGYSYDIANGKRQPSQRLAIRIWRELGEKLGPVRNLPDDVIAALERVQ